MWTVFVKTILNLLQYCSHFMVVVVVVLPQGMWNLSSPTRDQTHILCKVLATGHQGSPYVLITLNKCPLSNSFPSWNYFFSVGLPHSTVALGKQGSFLTLLLLLACGGQYGLASSTLVPIPL